MKFYSFSPIKTKEELLQAIEHVHFGCFKLCKQSLGKYLPVAGNMGIFCHYDDEYEYLTKLREEMTEASDNWQRKYYRLKEPIVIEAKDGVPETTYTYLYIRRPDPYRHHAGDVDFVVEEDEYNKLKQSIKDGDDIKGARTWERPTLDMIELYDPDIDALGYIGTKYMTEHIRVTSSQS